MKNKSCVVAVLVALTSFLLSGQEITRSPDGSSELATTWGWPTDSADASGYEVLSPEGVPVDADALLNAVRGKWYSLIPATALPPEKKQGTTAIDVVFLKDGTLGELKLAQSSGDDSMDAAARDAILAAAPFAGIPSKIRTGPGTLRLIFAYNQQPNGERPACNELPPGVYRSGQGVKEAHVLFNPNPEYTEDARKTKYQGTLALCVTVGTDGMPSNVRIARSLGMGLDERAVNAVQQWRFKPATRNGHPVPIQVMVTTSFHLY